MTEYHHWINELAAHLFLHSSLWGKWVHGESGHLSIFTLLNHLKHKDSFGKSENISQIFPPEIIVFDNDYEGKSSSSDGLLWISFIFYFL